MINTQKHNLLEYIVGISLIIILCFYIYFNYTKELKFKHFMNSDEKLNQLIILDEKINNFIDKRFEIILFDDINTILNSFQKTLKQLIENERKQNISSEYLKYLYNIEKKFQTKEFLIRKD